MIKELTDCKITKWIKWYWSLSLKERNEYRKARVLRTGHKNDREVLNWDKWDTFSEEEKEYRLNTVLKL